MTRISYKIGNKIWYKDDLGYAYYILIPSLDLASEFFMNFKELIMQANDLI